MVASEFEYRHRFWMIVLVYVAAYAFYNLDHLNILYSVVAWNQGVLQKDMLVRFLYAAAALLAAVGAILLTWSTAYRPPSAIKDRTAFSIAGPFRFVRNPQYLSYFLLILALGTFQSRLGFPVMLLAETILLLRLVAREELRLEQEYGERFRVYAQRVPRFLSPLASAAVRKRRSVTAMAPSSLGPNLSMGLRRHAACLRVHLERPNWVCLRLCDHCILVLQKLAQAFWIRLRRTYNS
jgi:protein-S-isoprenylcysteine O-methyltransferase Ste14